MERTITIDGEGEKQTVTVRIPLFATSSLFSHCYVSMGKNKRDKEGKNWHFVYV